MSVKPATPPPLRDVDPYVLQLLREDLAAISRRGYERGLVTGLSGNNSLRVPGTELVLIKSTGGCLGDMDTSGTVLVTVDGEILDPGRKPSKEWQFHLGIYRVRPDVGAVVHLHPPHAVAFAVADEPPPLVHAAARGHVRTVARIPLLPAGSLELANAVVDAFRDAHLRAALMREHGTITVAPDLRTAYLRTEYLDDVARVALLAGQATGRLPRELALADDLAPLAEAAG